MEENRGFDKMMTVKEVAEVLSISEGQVYKMIRDKSNGFPSMKFGKAIRVPEASLHVWLNARIKSLGRGC